MQLFIKTTPLVLLTFFSFIALSQNEPQRPTFEKKVYQNDGNIYVQKELPLYLKFSTEPNGPTIDLKSKSTPNHTDPMYLDTEGINYIRSKWAVNKETKKVEVPKFEVMYELYADGLPPITNSRFSGAPRSVSGGIIYYGKGLKIELVSRDGVSGVEKIHSSTNGAAYTTYNGVLDFSAEKAYVLYYFANDNVGNAEKTRKRTFTVDVTSPKTNHQIVGISHQGNIIAPSTKFTLSSNDQLSGVNVTYFSYDEGKKVRYPGYGVSVSYLSDGEHTLYYYSIDRVKNEESRQSFSFYLDKIPPVNTVSIVGDQHKVQGRIYVSSRTKVKITATDNKAGVESISYRLDGGATQKYSSPFSVPTKGGVRGINFYATDNVKNRNSSRSVASAVGVSQIYMDNKAPATGISYGSPKFFDRDTLFINNTSKVYLTARDYESGVQKVSYSVNGASATYTNPFTISNEGYQTILFRATDRVNNEEDEKTSHVFVDNSPPKIYHNFSIEPIGTKKKGGKVLNVYPRYTRLYLGATDKHCGTQTIKYSINGEPYYDYSSPYSLDVSEVNRFRKNKFHKVEVKVADKLGNEATTTIEFFVGE